MVKKQTRRQRDIKSKLLAAICMLLVSSIMMVSSTYAWFTLSTAPEVTGITTAVGANGNLEMALLPTNGQATSITSGAGDSQLGPEARNVTWGNLVDLGDSTIYGLNKITLNPSTLNTTTTGDSLAINNDFMLSTPAYGADGRVSDLVETAVTGTYDKAGSFIPSTQFGVRAVGNASGMTDRQLSYRSALSAGNTAMAQAKNAVIKTLTNNGAALADLAIKRGLNADATYSGTEILPLKTMVDELQADNGALAYIETAYMQYILAYAASSLNTAGDAAWSTVKTAVEASDATLASVQSALGTALGADFVLPDFIANGIQKYQATVTAVATASSNLPTITESKTDYVWAEFSDALNSLMDSSKMTINDMTVAKVKEDEQALMDSYTSTGSLILVMPSESGVFADIADQCGDYQATLKLTITYKGLTLTGVTSTMKTDTSVEPSYLATLAANVQNKTPEGTSTTNPISDFYGFVIDLAFKTNATNSNLLLQVDAADRIYSDNSNDETMGHGSTMTFASTTSDFNNDQLKKLMGAIRVVFFDPARGVILAKAKLDVANAEPGADGMTAKLYLYEGTAASTSTTYKEATDFAENTTYYTKATQPKYETISGADLTAAIADTTKTLYTLSGTTYSPVADKSTADTTGATTYYVENGTEDVYTAATGITTDNFASSGTLYVKVTDTTAATETFLTGDDAVITALTQNTPTAVSALVYLEGSAITNADVAATAATSMTGSMSLQFASSANLVPMEYANLHTPDSTKTPAVTTTAANSNTGAAESSAENGETSNP